MKFLTFTFLLSNIHQIQTKLLSWSHSNLNSDPLIHLWMPRHKYFENQTHHHIILLFNFCTAVLAIMYLMVSKRKEWRSKFGGQDKDAVGDITHNFTTPSSFCMIYWNHRSGFASMVMGLQFFSFFFFVWCLGKHFIWILKPWLWVCFNGYGFVVFYFFFSLFDVWVSILVDLLKSWLLFCFNGYRFAV